MNKTCSKKERVEKKKMIHGGRELDGREEVQDTDACDIRYTFL